MSDGAGDPGMQAPSPGDAPPVGHRWFAAVYGLTAGRLEAGPIGEARRSLLAGARGVVVDLGSGTGANLAHLRAAEHVHLVEPDPFMLRRLRARVAALPAGFPPVTIHQVGAERLPLDDAGADTVLATLTLCSVADPAAAAAEIRRVLRPGGRVLVLEHVRALEPARAARQDRFRRLWGHLMGGCDPSRDTAATLREAGLDTASLQRLRVPGTPLVGQWVHGSATAASGPPPSGR